MIWYPLVVLRPDLDSSQDLMKVRQGIFQKKNIAKLQSGEVPPSLNPGNYTAVLDLQLTTAVYYQVYIYSCILGSCRQVLNLSTKFRFYFTGTAVSGYLKGALGECTGTLRAKSGHLFKNDRTASRFSSLFADPGEYDDLTAPGGAQLGKLGPGPYLMTPVLDTG